jgi:hypothetical protein
MEGFSLWEMALEWEFWVGFLTNLDLLIGEEEGLDTQIWSLIVEEGFMWAEAI